jgi:hypothetical protein
MDADRAAAGTEEAVVAVVVAVAAVAADRDGRTAPHMAPAGTEDADVVVVASDASRRHREYTASARRRSGSSYRCRWPGQLPMG